MAIIKLSVAEQRRISAFLTCLVIAVCAWLFLAFSNPFDYVTKKVIRFKNVPLKRSFHSLQSDTIDVKVKGTGWQMLSSKLRPENNVITVDLSSLEVESYVALQGQLPRINREQPANNPIVAFEPDTLYFDFSDRSIRRVPVKLLSSLSFEKQFSQSDKVIIKPSYVTVSGPSNRVNNMKFWLTDSVRLKQVNQTTNLTVNVKAPDEGNLTIYPKTVQVTIPVNEFTEKTVQIPVKLINNNQYYNIKIIPQRVKVTFTTSLDRYQDMGADLFEAQVDVGLWQKYNYTSLPVTVTRMPPYCKIAKIEPRNIDFIVKK